MTKFRLIDSYPKSKVITISSEKQLVNQLNNIARNGNRVVLLHSSDSGTLTIGAGSPFGFVEYMNAIATPPYLIATNTSTNHDDFIEFDAGGILTPVSTRHCIEFERVIDIATFFLKSGKLSATVFWENI